MSSFLPQGNLELQKAFGIILSGGDSSDFINRVADLIYTNELDTPHLETLLKEYKVKDIVAKKNEILDLLLAYINLILRDHTITEREGANVKTLKRIFKIREGDFYHYKRDEIAAALKGQFECIYADNRIDNTEALLKVGLQELFDLSYDQFLEFVDKEVKAALDRGGSLIDLDTVLNPPGSSK